MNVYKNMVRIFVPPIGGRPGRTELASCDGWRAAFDRIHSIARSQRAVQGVYEKLCAKFRKESYEPFSEDEMQVIEDAVTYAQIKEWARRTVEAN